MTFTLRNSLRAMLVCSSALIATNAFAAGGHAGGGFGGGSTAGNIHGTLGGIQKSVDRTVGSTEKTVDGAARAADTPESIKASLPKGSVIIDNRTVMIPEHVTGSRLPEMVPVHMDTGADVKTAGTAVDTNTKGDGISVGTKSKTLGSTTHRLTRDLTKAHRKIAGTTHSLAAKAKTALKSTKTGADVKVAGTSLDAKTKGDTPSVGDKSETLGSTTHKVTKDLAKTDHKVAGIVHSLTGKTKSTLKSATTKLSAKTNALEGKLADNDKTRSGAGNHGSTTTGSTTGTKTGTTGTSSGRTTASNGNGATDGYGVVSRTSPN